MKTGESWAAAVTENIKAVRRPDLRHSLDRGKGSHRKYLIIKIKKE